MDLMAWTWSTSQFFIWHFAISQSTVEYEKCVNYFTRSRYLIYFIIILNCVMCVSANALQCMYQCSECADFFLMVSLGNNFHVKVRTSACKLSIKLRGEICI